MSNINRVVISGNLTHDPELRSTPGGQPVCQLRMAVNGRRKDQQTGEWVDKPNYFTVKVWGRQGENCANFLARGRALAVDGRLDWRQWDTPEGDKRQTIDIIADNVQFLGSRDAATQGNGGAPQAPQADVKADTSDFDRVEAGVSADDDIPF
jgi:single-strand DNA-binding protein